MDRHEPAVPADSGASRANDGDEPTVGTGSAVAVGCTAATLVVILVGIAVLLLVRWL